MKNKLVTAFIVLFLGMSLFALAGPQGKTSPKTAKSKTAKAEEPAPEILAPTLDLTPKAPQYDAAGRRDPFKDLLGGSQTKERSGAEGPELAIEDIHLIGIAKAKGQIYALISGPQGFPYRIKEGDKFADGYVLKITFDNVTFRQTMDRGLRLPSPKDIVKEINAEER